jgi:NADH dehydrogenase
VIEKGIELSILRPSVIFGQGDKFLNLFARLQTIAPIMPLAGADARFQPVWVEDVARAALHCLEHGNPAAATAQIFEACGPDVFTLRQLVELSGRLAGIRHGLGRPVIGLPDWAAQLQAAVMEYLPGPTLMSRDNLASMQAANVATPGALGLSDLGITAAALPPIAADYLSAGGATHGLLGVRQRARR